MKAPPAQPAHSSDGSSVEVEMGFYNPKTGVDSAGEDATQAQKHARGELFFAHSTVLRFVTDD